MSLSRGLIAAVVTALRGDEDVQAVVGERVFGEAPASSVFPYAAIAGWRTREWGAGGERGEELVLTLACFARTGGREVALAAADACAAVLDGAAFELQGARVVGLFFQDGEAALEKDRQTWRAVSRFRALVEAG